MIDPITGWFEIMQHNKKRAIPISKSIENKWLYRYPKPI